MLPIILAKAKLDLGGNINPRCINFYQLIMFKKKILHQTFDMN